MNQPPPLPAKPRRLRVFLLIAALISTVIYFRGYVGCMLYPECNPLLSVPEMPPWNVPTNAVEKAGYDFAHALQLPDGVPKPVPFNFGAARIKAIESSSSAFEIHQDVAQRYFDHLCETEAGVTVFDTVENIEGVSLLRGERREISKPWTYDRYGTEDALSHGGNYMESDKNGGGFHGTPVEMIQPYRGHYTFIEYPDAESGGGWVRFVRKINPQPPYPYTDGFTTYAPAGLAKWLPFMVVRNSVATPIAKYAITWRGVRRERDREFAIAAAEMVALEVGTKRVLAVNRDFLLSGRDIHPSGVWWGNAKSCRDRRNPQLGFYVQDLANLVLKPVASVNENVTASSSLKN